MLVRFPSDVASAATERRLPMTADDGIRGGADRSLVARVRKLLDKAAATSNVHEADAFSRKAAELVARHRIDPDALADLVGDDLGLREIPLGRGPYVRARLALLTAVAEEHDARVVFAARPTGTIAYVAGYRSDLDVVEVMYNSLHTQAATRMARERRSTGAATQAHRRAFLFGFADQIGKLLEQARRSAEAEASRSTRGAGVALARRERGERAEEFLGERFGRIRAARSPRRADLGGWVAGSEAAARADLGRARLGGRRSLGPG
jgi:Protein of unknown function (DUF2786)